MNSSYKHRGPAITTGDSKNNFFKKSLWVKIKSNNMNHAPIPRKGKTLGCSYWLSLGAKMLVISIIIFIFVWNSSCSATNMLILGIPPQRHIFPFFISLASMPAWFHCSWWIPPPLQIEREKKRHHSMASLLKKLPLCMVLRCGVWEFWIQVLLHGKVHSTGWATSQTPTPSPSHFLK